MDDADRAAAALTIDPTRSNVILCVGTKGSGKSEAARVIFDAWPGNRIALDVTGDARPEDPDTIILTAPFPSQMPDPLEDRPRVTVWARVDPRSPTYNDDQDAAVAMGLYPRLGEALLWDDEFAELATASMIPPNTKLAIISSRHYHLSMLLCCPRPARIPILAISQSDLVLVFETPRRDDRKILADNMGYPHALFEAAYRENRLRGDHALLLWDKRQKRLFDLPELPLRATHGPRA